MCDSNAMRTVVLLQAGLIEHLTCYVFTGRLCSLRRAARLAAELAGSDALSEATRGHWQGLAAALEDMLPAPAEDKPGAGIAPAPAPARARRQPWLVWESVEGVA